MKIIDLLNKIAKGELPNKTKFKVHSSCNNKDNGAFICEYDESYPGVIWCINNNCKFNYKIDYMRILNYEVELIEDEIDIQSIEEINIDQVIETDDKTGIALLHINKLIKAVKQLDNKIQEN